LRSVQNWKGWMGNRAAQFVAACLICAVGAEDGGGWSLPADLSLADEGTCTIEVLDGSELSHQQFIERTWSSLLGAQINMTCSVCRYAFSRPVVLRGLTDNTKFQRLCSKSSLLEKYGSLKVRLSTANTHSYRKVDVLLQEYVDEFLRPQSEEVLGSETLYFFGDNNFTEWQNLFDQYESPPYVLPDTTRAYSFGIAGPGTGVPFHWHGPGYSEVIYGRKVISTQDPWSLKLCDFFPFWHTAVVPLPAGKEASFPPEPHHPVLGDRNISLPAGGGGSAGVHDPARRGSVLSRPLVACYPQPGHQCLHLHLSGLSFIYRRFLQAFLQTVLSAG
ncbi:hypothetical protein XENOCAPTIV_015720, partial [Xenoophorus captivus]